MRFLIVPLALAHLLAACAPRIGRVTMSAIVVYESGARPFAIGDNTARRSYFPGDAVRAEALAERLLGARHNIDVGYAQINSNNFASLGLDAHRALEPCNNLRAAAYLLERSYSGAARTYGPGQVALVHALSAYNTGGYWAGLDYAKGVYATAATFRAVPFHRASSGATFAP